MLMIAAASLLAVLLAAPIATPQGERERPPSVLLVLADDLGWGELGAYGQQRIRTPHLDALAARGMRFTNAYSGSPVCAPSRCVLLTGRNTGHAQVRDNKEQGGWGPDEPEGQHPLATDTVTVGRLLQDAGWRTACIGKWGLGGPGSSGAPNAQGFDRFFGLLCQRVAHNFYPTHLWRDDQRVELEGNAWFPAHQELDAPLEEVGEYAQRYAAETYACDAMLDEALGFLDACARDGDPFFLYYASPLPHLALQVPERYLDPYPARWDTEPYLGNEGYLPHPRPRAAYAGMISRLDEEVGALLARLEDHDRANDTLVIVTSDNGPSWVGGVDREFFGSSGGLRGRKAQLYEGGIRVPFVAAWPGRIEAGSTSHHVLAFQDLLPTLCDVLGVEAPEDGLDGLSFASTLLDSGVQPEHDALYFEFPAARQQALRSGKWKALRTRIGRDGETVELYDLVADPFETNDMSATEPALAASLRARMDAARVPSEAFPFPGLDPE